MICSQTGASVKTAEECCVLSLQIQCKFNRTLSAENRLDYTQHGINDCILRKTTPTYNSSRSAWKEALSWRAHAREGIIYAVHSQHHFPSNNFVILIVTNEYENEKGQTCDIMDSKQRINDDKINNPCALNDQILIMIRNSKDCVNLNIQKTKNPKRFL